MQSSSSSNSRPQSQVLLGVTGGIAAYKALDIVSGLMANGHLVRVIMTKNATRFVNKLSFTSLSGRQTILNM